MKHLESEEQKKLVQWLQIKNIFHFAVPNGAVLKGNKIQRAIQMNTLKSEGLKNGTSDIIVMLPNKILFIEMKQSPIKLKSGKLSTASISVADSQIEFISEIKKFGYANGAICYGFNQAKSFIESELS